MSSSLPFQASTKSHCCTSSSFPANFEAGNKSSTPFPVNAKSYCRTSTSILTSFDTGNRCLALFPASVKSICRTPARFPGSAKQWCCTSKLFPASIHITRIPMHSFGAARIPSAVLQNYSREASIQAEFRCAIPRKLRCIQNCSALFPGSFDADNMALWHSQEALVQARFLCIIFRKLRCRQNAIVLISPNHSTLRALPQSTTTTLLESLTVEITPCSVESCFASLSTNTGVG